MKQHISQGIAIAKTAIGTLAQLQENHATLITVINQLVMPAVDDSRVPPDARESFADLRTQLAKAEAGQADLKVAIRKQQTALADLERSVARLP